MLPQKHFDKIEKAAAELLNHATADSLGTKKSKKVIEIKENTIDKNVKSTTVSDDEYVDDYDYNYDDDSENEDDDIVTMTSKTVSATTKCKCFFPFISFLFLLRPTRFGIYQTCLRRKKAAYFPKKNLIIIQIENSSIMFNHQMNSINKTW